MKLGVFTVMLPAYAPAEAVAALAGAGFDGVEWRVKDSLPEHAAEAPSFWRNNRCTWAPGEVAGRQARAMAVEAGLELPCGGAYVEVGDEAGFRKALAFARGAGLPRMRLLTARWKRESNYRELFDRTCAFWDWAVPQAAEAGVKLLGETHHDTICPSASLLMRLLSRFPAAKVGMLYDPGNMVWEGYETYDLGLQLAGEYLAHVHLKNVRFEADADGRQRPRWSSLWTGVVSAAEVFQALHRVGYDGWICLEDFSGETIDQAWLTANRQRLRQAWIDAGSP